MTSSRKSDSPGSSRQAWGFGAAALLLATLAACGGKGSTGPSASPLAGVWSAPAEGGGTIYALVMPTGELRILNPDYSMVAAPAPSLAGANLSGTAYLFQPGPVGTSPAPTQQVLSGTATASALNLVLTDAVANTSTKINLTPDKVSNIPATPASVAGTYTTSTAASDGVGGTITLSAVGGLTGGSSLETVSGTATPAASGLNAFNVSITYDSLSGTSAALTGAAFCRPSAGANQLILMSDDGTSQFSGVFNGSASAAVKSGETPVR